MKRHEDALFGALENKLVLYGEWCYAAHSIVYKRLPDYFLAFDIYDIAAQRFWNCTRRDALVRGLGLAQRPRVAAGKFDRESVLRLIGNSTLYDGLMEGIYLRQDGPL